MDLSELKMGLEKKFRNQVPARIFLDRLRVPDAEFRASAAYNDPRFAPVYFWLGQLWPATSLVEIGFQLALFSANYLRACPTVTRFVALHQAGAGYYSPRLARKNVRDVYGGPIGVHVGQVHDEEFDRLLGADPWDLVIVNEEVGYDVHRAYLDVAWAKTRLDGLIVMDHVTRHRPAAQAYHDFCKAKNRDPVVVNSRYGVGLIQR